LLFIVRLRLQYIWLFKPILRLLGLNTFLFYILSKILALLLLGLLFLVAGAISVLTGLIQTPLFTIR